MGAMNYPEVAKNSGIFGSLIMTVSINSEGMIENMIINKGSGQKALDEAAMNIVKMGEPYAKFSNEMKKEVDIINITRRWKFTEDNNFSSRR
jgi:protein TonB